MAFTPEFVKPLIELTGAEPCGWHRPSAIGTVADKPVVVTMIGAGAPRSVSLAEPLFGGGVKTMLALGATGSLQPSIRIGDYMVPTSAIREEGTSFHYMPPDYEAIADNRAAGTRRPVVDDGRAVSRVRREGKGLCGTGRAGSGYGDIGADGAGGFPGSRGRAGADGERSCVRYGVAEYFQDGYFTRNLAETAAVVVAAARILLGSA